MEKLANELDDKNKEYEMTRRTLQNQLDSASNEIEKSHNSYRNLESKWLTLLKETEKEKEKIKVLEETLTIERSEHLKIVKGLHGELNNEKDVCE